MAPIFLSLNPPKSIEKDFLTYLEYVYTDTKSSAAFSSPQTVLNFIKKENKYSNIGITRLRRYMARFESTSLNKSRPNLSKATRRYGIIQPNVQVESDLMSVRRFSKFNNGVEYLLVVIDVFSKFGYAEPIKDKNASTVVGAFNKILSRMSIYPKVHHSDLGSEFTGVLYKTNLKAKNIRQTFAKQSGHSYQVEIFIRTLRRLFRAYRTEYETNKFINQLPAFLSIYNSRKHSRTKYPPKSVTNYNAVDVASNLYSKYENRPSRPFKYKQGDSVRIITEKSLFDKYQTNFSLEVFTIASRFRKDGLNIYTVAGCDGPIVGEFYEREVTLAPNVKESTLEVDKYLDEKRVNGVTYVLVSFKNRPNNEQCNAWFKRSDIK